MYEDKQNFAALIVSRRQEEFEALKRARERRLQERKTQKKNEREIARRHEFVRRCRQQVQDRVSANDLAPFGSPVTPGGRRAEGQPGLPGAGSVQVQHTGSEQFARCQR